MKIAIILGGHTMALGVVRSLGMMGVPVVLVHYSDHDFAYHSRYVKVSLRAPHPESSEKEFINFLCECGSRFPGAVLFPVSDESLAAVSRNKKLLDQHFLVACTDWEISQRFIDKQFTYKLAEKCGVPAPRTMVPHSLEEIRSASKEFGFPCLIKPCQSHLFFDYFGRKMFRIESLERLEEVFSKTKDAGLEVMIQEIIPGDDINVINYNSYLWEGEFLTEFTAVHIRNGPPWTGPPRVVVSRNVPEVIEPGRRILREMGFSGYSCIEFKRDSRDGLYKVLDVNGRHNLSTLLAVHCGINFPWQHYCHLSEGTPPQASDFRKEVYWIDLIRDVGYTGIYLFRERQSLIDYLRPYFKPHVFAIFDLKDLGPFFKRVGSLMVQVKKKIFGS
jgi:D-aspartate ligase